MSKVTKKSSLLKRAISLIRIEIKVCMKEGLKSTKTTQSKINISPKGNTLSKIKPSGNPPKKSNLATKLCPQNKNLLPSVDPNQR